MSLNERQFGKMLSGLIQHGGFSASPTTGKPPKHGFMVSIPGQEVQVPTADVTTDVLKAYVSDHAEALSPGTFVGGWDNKGETSLDVSQNVRPDKRAKRQYGRDVAIADARTAALDLSVARNQEAAFDLKTMSDVPNKDYSPRR